MEMETAGHATSPKTLISQNKKRKEISPEEAVLSNIDLLIQILTRVPPNPLITFQIVSKNWLSIISGTDFTLTHTHHHLTTHPPSSLSLFNLQRIPISIENGEKYTVIFPKLDCLEGVRKHFPTTSQLNMISSCNGLILFQYGYRNPYVVLNPITQKHRVLPKPLGSCGYGQGLGTVLAFDPLNSFHYKVIRFRYVHYPGFMVDIDIFSSEIGAWKEIHLQNPHGDVLCCTRMIFWNGAIHWMVRPNFHVRFIVDEEKFSSDQLLTNPDIFPEGGHFGYFGKSDNGLLLIKFSSGEYYQEWNKGFTVLEMDKDNCWIPKHQVSLKSLASKYPNMYRVLENGGRRLQHFVLNVKSGTNDGEFSMVLAIPEKVILYEVKRGNGGSDSKVICDIPDLKLVSYYDMHSFLECLAPVL